MSPTRHLAALLSALLAALVLAGCGGGGPPDQVGPPARDEMTGTVTGGDTTGPLEAAGEYAAKGTAGILRVANVKANSLDYQISLSQLTGPYALRAILMDDQAQTYVYTVAPAAGTANITPLTTLLMAQLYGQDPAAIYNAFGAGGSIDPARITTANLAAAQVQLVTYLKDELGITVPASAGSFVTTPFRAVAGDPVYDTVVAIKQKLADDGSSFQELSTRVALAARQCLAEKVSIAIGGTTSEFCPSAKTAIPDDNDATRVDYVFTNRRDDRLTVQVQADTVLGAAYETAAGASYTCTGAACAAIVLGSPAADRTRSIAFNALTLAGDGGNAVLNGTFTGAIPGIDIPLLPCDTNRFVAIVSDRSVIAQCADPDPGGFGVGGVPGGLIGVETSRGTFDFSAPFGPDPTLAKVSLVTDGHESVLAVQVTDNEPDTYVPRRRFVCTFAQCNGITLGPVKINTDFGGPDFPFYVRTIEFNDTQLSGVDDKGVATGLTATLRASLTIAYLLPLPPLQYPALADCAEGLSALPASAGGSSFNACVPPGQSATNPDTGDLELNATSIFDSDDKLFIVVRNGAVASATLRMPAIPGDFVCNMGCAGITVSAPDGAGVRTVTLDGAVLNEQLLLGFAGPRTVTLGSVALEFTPSP